MSSLGIKPDPDLLASISDFPVPTDRRHVRSFLGLAVQLGNFLPDLAHNTTLLRKLTSEKNAFLWLDSHQQQFQSLKKILTSPMLVKPFDPTLDTFLVTDASRLYGLGYALLQRHTDHSQRLIKCGSCSLTSTQNNYATIELECLAICLLYTSPSPRDGLLSRMPSSA